MNGAYVANSSVYSPPGYSVQLNVELSNGYTAQNAWGFPHFDGNVLRGTSVGGTVWSGNGVLHFRIGPPVPDCGWLVIGINGSTLYFEYSVDGKSINWYHGYDIGSNASIIPGVETNLIVTGLTNEAGVNFTSLYVALALYYWNGIAWTPAPIRPGVGPVSGWVMNAWVYTSGNEAVISWPQSTNSSTAMPSTEPPSFTP